MADEPNVIALETPEGQQLNHFYGLARHVRGSFMEQAIWTDVIVTEILAQYFVHDKDKRALFSSDVITSPGFPFSERIKILKKVISQSYGSFAQECPNLGDLLDKIRRFRNRLAHAHLDTSAEFMAKGYADRFQIIFYEDGIAKKQSITVEESNERLKECSTAMLQLVKLQALVTENLDK